jgi:hypothetical protein
MNNLTQTTVQVSAPPALAALGGVKELAFLIEGWLQEGRSEQAVEFLVSSGCDRQTARSQVQAVHRQMRNRAQNRSNR